MYNAVLCALSMTTSVIIIIIIVIVVVIVIQYFYCAPCNKAMGVLRSTVVKNTVNAH